MARYRDAVCRLCRREGMKLFLKGAKCFTDKCPIEKRNFAPGQHGKDRKAKVVGYGLQLREKQKAKRMYFTQEGQFRNYFERRGAPRASPANCCCSSSSAGWTTLFIASALPSARRQARQLVRHGHVAVNGRKVNIPSFQVNAGDEIGFARTATSSGDGGARRNSPAIRLRPGWKSIATTYKGRVLALPKREDINLPINEQLIVELYSK